MSWWTKKHAPEVATQAPAQARHVAIGFTDPVAGPRQLVDATGDVCARLGLTMTVVSDEAQLITAADDMTSADVVVFPHFDALTLGIEDGSDPHWQGTRLSPATASASGVTYVVGTTGQDGITLQTLQTLFGSDVKSMLMLAGSARELAKLELLLEEALGA
ncbi:hypothetical protein [Demequina zhanjiangensis]|uniref:Uncharacterized protein n=1 Tax=Demequina zhanjiangensis TaxID=3051659 RepID=A0ABT8G2T2_9MICO|nr:hypothetical protein [Demequina sp. SYSU T00b26]MDN4473455.1 hypothetical protein [Demequina sp. SYSU T00b26]